MKEFKVNDAVYVPQLNAYGVIEEVYDYNKDLEVAYRVKLNDSSVIFVKRSELTVPPKKKEASEDYSNAKMDKNKTYNSIFRAFIDTAKSQFEKRLELAELVSYLGQHPLKLDVNNIMTKYELDDQVDILRAMKELSIICDRVAEAYDESEDYDDPLDDEDEEEYDYDEEDDE